MRAAQPPNSPRGAPVDQRILATVGFTDHAIERFAQRADLPATSRAHVEAVIRDLLLQEGVLTQEQPRWARSRNTAPLYLQLGDWMLFVLRPDPRRPGRHTAVTVVNGPATNDWATALRRGYITTPPPPQLRSLPPLRISLGRVIRDVLAERRAGTRRGHLPRQALATYRERRHEARNQRAAVADANQAAQVEYEAARARARDRRR